MSRDVAALPEGDKVNESIYAALGSAWGLKSTSEMFVY